MDPHLTVYTKLNSKWTIGLDVKPKTIKLFRKKLGGNIYELRQIFSDMTLKAQYTKDYLENWTSSKLKTYILQKTL